MKNILINKFDKNNTSYKQQFAKLLTEAFPHSYKDCAKEEVASCLEPYKVAFAATKNGKLIGFVGAMPQYSTTGWELHPLVVKKEYQQKGIGSMMLNALENEVRLLGGVVIYLGTDDEFDKTSLSNTNLWENLFKKIENIENLSKHPYEFYKKQGYKIVGVIPDANGVGKPDIIMAKKIV